MHFLYFYSFFFSFHFNLIFHYSSHTQMSRPLHIVCCACSDAQLHPTLCDPMDCRPLGSSVHRILPARTLEWVAISSSRESSWPRDRTHISCISWIAGGFFIYWVIGEDPQLQIQIPRLSSISPSSALTPLNGIMMIFQDRTQEVSLLKLCPLPYIVRLCSLVARFSIQALIFTYLDKNEKHVSLIPLLGSFPHFQTNP